MTTTELERVVDAAPPVPTTLFGTDDPDAFLESAGTMATALKKMLVSSKLIMKIQQREYVKVDGLVVLGSMLGVFPVTRWSRRIEHDGDTGWEARVEAITRDGTLIGAAEASCMRSERQWKSRDDYALRSMAQTRATGKAMRQPLGFVVAMAGYESTPAEEIPNGVVEQSGSFMPPAKGPKASPEQVADVEALIAVAVEGGVSRTGIEGQMIADYKTRNVADLSQAQAENMLNRLKAAQEA